VSDAAEGLRHIYAALRATVREDGPGWVIVRFFTHEPLTNPIPPAPLPELPSAEPLVAPALTLTGAEAVEAQPAPEPMTVTGEQALQVLRRLPLGWSEDGTPGCSTSWPLTSSWPARPVPVRARSCGPSSGC
jgi:hypothetical protein